MEDIAGRDGIPGLNEPVKSSFGNREEPELTHRRTALGVIAGGALFLGIMLLFAGAAVAFGWIRRHGSGPVNLTPWLILEIVGGGAASALGGAVSRRIARRDRGPAVLALVVFSVALLEAAEILHHMASGNVVAPRLLVLLAPFVPALGTLCGGWLVANGSLEAQR